MVRWKGEEKIFPMDDRTSNYGEHNNNFLRFIYINAH